MAQSQTAESEQDTKATSEGILSGLEASASHLAERGAVALNNTVDAGRDYFGRIRVAGQGSADRVYKTVHRKAEEAAFYAELGYEEARDWTRAHPAQALGIAAGAGLLIGLLVARR